MIPGQGTCTGDASRRYSQGPFRCIVYSDAHLKFACRTDIRYVPERSRMLGLSTPCERQVKQGLGIRESTVKGHISVIFTRLDANDRTQAVIAGLERGYPKTHRTGRVPALITFCWGRHPRVIVPCRWRS